MKKPVSSSSWTTLTPAEKRVIVDGGTEAPFTGKFTDHAEEGVYVCKRCRKALYASHSKFHSGCGWPAFEVEIEGAVRRLKDADGQRTEIRCANCDGHLGHVFEGERFTATNTRHCVNSISMDFVPAQQLDTAVFAAGCFWGVQYHFDRAPGVIRSDVGYTGGHLANPTYKDVLSHGTGHLEAMRVVYDRNVTDFGTLAKLFFEIHDPTQKDGQGPDIGEQYLSAVFSSDPEQIKVVDSLIGVLRQKGLDVATQVRPEAPFWRAEEYHQSYYDKKGGEPYCHVRQAKF